MPPGFDFCRACARDLTWDHRVELWTAYSRTHLDPHDLAAKWRCTQAKAAAISHLNQFSTAV